MSRVRLLAAIALIVGLAVVLGVVLGRERSSDTAQVGASSASEPAPLAPPPPERVPVPTPDNLGRDFDHIWREIRRFADWTYTNPELGLRSIHLIYHPECPCHQELQRALSGLVEDEVHFEDLVTRVESVVVTSDLGEAVRVETRMSIAPRRVVDAQGVTRESDQGVPARDFAVNLELQSDGRWLARTISLIEPS